MAAANENTAPPLTAKLNYIDLLFEKAKKLPTGKMDEIGNEVRRMRVEAAADQGMAGYYDILCRSYLNSEANSVKLDASFKNWQKRQQQEEKKRNEEAPTKGTGRSSQGCTSLGSVLWKSPGFILCSFVTQLLG
jgi:hypothetical protein